MTGSDTRPPLDDRALVARLIGFDTTSRTSNLPLADFLSTYLERRDVRILRNPSADGTKTNLIVVAGPEMPDRGGLVLSGHMDVVPAEELDWHLGARRFTESYACPERLPRNVVIGEPTDLHVVRAHKGMRRLRLAFSGRAAHSGYPHLGQSAIEPAARAIMALTASAT